MNEFRREYGAAWSDYTVALDLEYGVAKWAEKEMLVYNGTGIRSGEGFRYYQLIAQQNVGGSCGAVTEFPVQNPNAFWHIFRVIGAVEGQTSTWKDAFEHTVQNVIAGGASIRDELYGYTVGAVIDLVLRPPAETLQAVTITGFTDNGGGSYTLQWTKPAGTTSQRVKWGGKQIVDWIGYNPAAGAFTGDPANTMNWFAATEATGSPACAGAACSLTMATGQAGLAAGNFSVKAYAPEPVAVPRIRGRATLTGAGTLR
jgi:hypothetical protein